jgi:hypothetical protein
MTVTVPAPITRHLSAYLAAAVVVVALLFAAVVGVIATDSDSSPAVRETGTNLSTDIPSRFDVGRIGSPDALERRALDDPRRYGSPEAAEAYLR